ncbi:alpha/beta fold hydrolase [Variovorax sp. EL159]|uniref:alpha/beta fold hydrolase n=1 Tax=Variovorax sp. EL159 TaxID=1566270 RepID=UPI0008896222|nr:alpha/beta hydrolase [Variovorax sp. EL159]SCX57054.1 Pimeloyl-ACP methyl ester carboxylesterase [Variovorax sp. EL159]
MLRALAACPPAFALAGVAGLAACGGSSGARVGVGAGTGNGPVAVTDRRVKVSGTPDVSLQVRDWQRPGTTGPTIVLLPGLGGNARCFDSLAPALASRSRVLAISRRGYGLSDKPVPVKTATQHYEVDTLTSDLKAVLDELGLLRVVLGGHSIAGNELTRFAGRYPERVRGLVYLDTTFDYTLNGDTGGEELPLNRRLDEPRPTARDSRSLQAAIAFNRRKTKNWWPPLEANLLDAVDLRIDGSVRMKTSEAIDTAVDTAAHSFSPDYKAVRAPALVVTALPADNRDLFPWLELPLDAKTEKDAADYLRIFRRARISDSNLLVAALNTPHRLTLDNCGHTDFYMEREAEVLRAIQFMTWA